MELDDATNILDDEMINDIPCVNSYGPKMLH